MSSCLRHSPASRFKRGVLVSTPSDSDKAVEREVIQCCHCQFTQVWTPGIEKGWGLCWRCHDFRCPKPACRMKCVPIRQWLENMHRGRAEDYTPVSGRVEAEPPTSPGGIILGSK